MSSIAVVDMDALLLDNEAENHGAAAADGGGGGGAALAAGSAAGGERAETLLESRLNTVRSRPPRGPRWSLRVGPLPRCRGGDAR